MQTAIILSIGDELVLGQTVDTNSAWMSQQLAAIGCGVVAHMTTRDDQAAIERAINESIGRCDYLIISGGIGPTDDDLTRQAIASVMNVELELNDVWLKQLDTFFKDRGRPMPEKNRIQAMIPKGATMLFNHAGTAAGIDAIVTRRKRQFGPKVSEEYFDQMFGKGWSKFQKWCEENRSERNERLEAAMRLRLQAAKLPHNQPDPLALKDDVRVFAVPGVPKEMKAMVERDVLPVVAKSGGGAVILSRTLHTFGMGESAVAEKIGDLMDRNRNPSVGTTVAGGIVSLRVNSRCDSLDEAKAKLESTCDECKAALGNLIFGEDGRTIAQHVNQLLTQSRQTVTTAESCTGGLLSAMITDVPGSSAIFKMGWVTYSNLAKYERLGVPTDVINVYGAVSENVVAAMAKNAKRLSKSTYALAISGVAGPDGGGPTKPVGTVCIGFCFDNDKPPFTRTFNFTGDREMIRDRSAKMALTILRFHLLGEPLPF